MSANDNEYMTMSEGLQSLNKTKAGWKRRIQRKKESGDLSFEEMLNMKQSIERIETIKKRLFDEHC